MRAGRATCAADQSDRFSGSNVLVWLDEDAREVTVAYGEVAVADGEEVAGTSIVSDFGDLPEHHGVNRLTGWRTEIHSVV